MEPQPANAQPSQHPTADILDRRLRMSFDPHPLTSCITFKISQVFGGGVTQKEKVFTPLKVTNGNSYKVVS